MIWSFIVSFISDDDVLKQLISIINSTNNVSFNRNFYIFVKSVFFNLFISKILRSCSISQFSIFNFDNDNNISDDVIIKANVYNIILKSLIIFINRYNSIFRDFMNISLIFFQLFNLIKLLFQHFKIFFEIFSAISALFFLIFQCFFESALSWISLLQRSRLTHFEFQNVSINFQHISH